MKTLAIGDIHGCYRALHTLITQVEPGPDDRLIFLGDYTSRGPASKAVLDFLIDWGRKRKAVFLRGNHEVMMLQARTDKLEADIWLGSNGIETLESYGLTSGNLEGWAERIPPEHWHFVEQTLPYLETPRHILVHACLEPALDLKEQASWYLYWETFDRMLPHRSGKKIVCGHTSQHSRLPNDVGYAVCIDTGAATGGWLSCLDIESGDYWQSNEKGETRGGKITPYHLAPPAKRAGA